MLEQLFGSRTRVKLLKVFLTQADDCFYVRELMRKVGERINSVRRELANLERMGVVNIKKENATQGQLRKRKVSNKAEIKKYYCVNKDFVLYQELKNLVVKSELLVPRGMPASFEKLGRLKLLLLSGFFVGDNTAPTDLFVVGSVNRRRFVKFLKQLERSIGREINYTVLSTQEFKLRMDLTDRFLYRILEGKHLTLIDRIKR